jgi:hypothetical protein
MSERKKSTVLWIAAGIASALLLCAYVGAYYKMARPARVELPGGVMLPGIHPIWGVEAIDTFVWRQKTVSAFFWPIHQLDRRLRPRVWNR